MKSRSNRMYDDEEEVVAILDECTEVSSVVVSYFNKYDDLHSGHGFYKVRLPDGKHAYLDTNQLRKK